MESPSDWAQLYSHTFAKQEIPCHEDHPPFVISDQISSTTTAANTFGSTMNHMAGANNMSSRDTFHHLSYTADGRVSKPSRKRTRVPAKKDHTTILDTDINNFRAMVQQFTGAPQAVLLSMPSVPRVNLADHNYSSAGMAYDQQAASQLIHPLHQQQQLMMQLMNNNHRNDGFGNNKHVGAKMERADGFVIADSNNSSRSTTTTTSSSYEMFPSSFDHENRSTTNGFVSF